jgi:hypothetical protein
MTFKNLHIDFREKYTLLSEIKTYKEYLVIFMTLCLGREIYTQGQKPREPNSTTITYRKVNTISAATAPFNVIKQGLEDRYLDVFKRLLQKMTVTWKSTRSSTHTHA